MQKLLKNERVNKNSWIHFGVCFGLSAIGSIFGASGALAVVKETPTAKIHSVAGIITGLAANYGLLKLFGVL